jgi:hypothetical protein
MMIASMFRAKLNGRGSVLFHRRCVWSLHRWFVQNWLCGGPPYFTVRAYEHCISVLCKADCAAGLLISQLVRMMISLVSRAKLTERRSFWFYRRCLWWLHRCFVQSWLCGGSSYFTGGAYNHGIDVSCKSDCTAVHLISQEVHMIIASLFRAKLTVLRSFLFYSLCVSSLRRCFVQSWLCGGPSYFADSAYDDCTGVSCSADCGAVRRILQRVRMMIASVFCAKLTAAVLLISQDVCMMIASAFRAKLTVPRSFLFHRRCVWSLYQCFVQS